MPGMRGDKDGPVFAEPWEAQAFALVVSLHEKGAFTWTEWAETLSATIAQAGNQGSYYEHWLQALERIVSEKSLVTNPEVIERSEAWERALAATPHGEPILLENGKTRSV